ncbi:hypothetical protein B0H12DRAFT_391992 [Mycena haematopus]|nr:hypothetical protein B0H12DRAFT_391992 [Mycena haematopus]
MAKMQLDRLWSGSRIKGVPAVDSTAPPHSDQGFSGTRTDCASSLQCCAAVQCEADLPSSLRFGQVEVGCEGWSRPGDSYVLAGSCSLEYRLVRVPGSLRDSDSDNWLGRQSFNPGSLLFTLLWLVVLALIVYSFLQSCMRGPQNRVGARPDPPQPGNSGFFPGGFNNDDTSAPPPPYSKGSPVANEGWRPGFWTGAALGGLGAHLLGNRQNQNQNSRAYDWERDRTYRSPPGTGGFFGQRGTARPSQEDRGEGSSNLGAMRRSTGLGGSSVR